MAAGLARLGDLAHSPVVSALADAFRSAGRDLAVVGGPVRDALLGRDTHDLDFTTDARPDEILRIVTPISSTQWDIGRAFGTIGARIRGEQVEITTYRADSYDGTTRKPVVAFGDSLEGDLTRRDFSVNAMALRVPSVQLVDPTGGVEDLVAGTLRTPIDPTVSFGDDPLRMLRAARFASQLGFDLEAATLAAISELRGTLSIVSPERIQSELIRLAADRRPDARDPRDGRHGPGRGVPARGIGAAARGRRAPSPQGRLRALPHGAAPGDRARADAQSGRRSRRRTAHRRAAARHRQAAHAQARTGRRRDVPSSRRRRIAHGEEAPAGAEVRHGDDRIRGRSSSNCTCASSAMPRARGPTRPCAGTCAMRATSSSVCTSSPAPMSPPATSGRLRLRAGRTTTSRHGSVSCASRRRSTRIRPDLDGNQIQQILKITPGPAVGRAYKFLMDLRLDEGPLGDEEAERACGGVVGRAGN